MKINIKPMLMAKQLVVIMVISTVVGMIINPGQPFKAGVITLGLSIYHIRDFLYIAFNMYYLRARYTMHADWDNDEVEFVFFLN